MPAATRGNVAARVEGQDAGRDALLKQLVRALARQTAREEFTKATVSIDAAAPGSASRRVAPR